MDIKAFKLPPLPNRRLQPAQGMSPILPPTHRPRCFSRDKRLAKEEESNSISRPLNRPSSVRSYSRESVKSRDSRQSRGSSRENSVNGASQRINHNAKIRVSMPSVSAKSWAVYQMKQGKFIYGKRTFKKREIASLTKMMNFITILDLVKDFRLFPSKIRVKVSKDASITGTTANLRYGMVLTLEDLYYGMMLPSGNDAAYLIAQVGGCLLLLERYSDQARNQIIYSQSRLTEFLNCHPEVVRLFLGHMNKVSKRLQMTNSHFANPHGLSNSDNYSCAQDICKLASACMQNQTFRLVVATQIYEGRYILKRQLIPQGEDSQNRYRQEEQIEEKGTLVWQNTNKLLKHGWSGIKTGITQSAGPCLAASVWKMLKGREFQFLVVLVNSRSMEARWEEARSIVEWVVGEGIYI